MPGAYIDTYSAPGVGARLRQRLAVWRIRRRIRELSDACAIGREMIRNDEALIARQEAQIAALRGELLQLGGLTTCEKS